MDTFTAPLLRRVIGLATAPALVLGLAACGDDDDDSAGASFCDGAESMETRFGDVDDPASPEFGDALDAIAELDPPAEIEDDWNAMVQAFERLADVDMSDPEAIAALDLDTEELEAASERVSTYLEEECGIDAS